MNLILLSDNDFTGHNLAVLRDERRVKHILGVHRADVGDTLKVGLVNDKVGEGTITAIKDCSVTLSVALTSPPPIPSNVRLILALPRPPMLKRILQTISTLGIKELVLLQSSRVDKSYWQTPQLNELKIREELILGLEQARDTVLPQISFAKRFRPFVEDSLIDFVGTEQGFVAHPYARQSSPHNIEAPCVIAIGPEGGFLDKEVDEFSRRGFTGISLGERILRVETAVTYLLGRFSNNVTNSSMATAGLK
ncbi:16S rRNA (uracil(1498)-N(3))-methyltransferase [Gilvimarinus sp. SDUM040013]|uniref:Ribosomal RNA small subunit methyltransferase E n=1 Tax=Gilvimarinus gilvus TaxID=3058038 RepID=A0ABU4RW26_9GAMM|nr:16S rRNA (uracil(1498)-N(3))-methyltransferase [Gilvimarinus sp. SDUM040013]MDO3385091.1 16S rRNA (uracil(1498)-N(3))-methyltransferase [Gilvimarinus sp. SDUM040013]MDX6848466.1 16S rRNA (uracil(1498)-N(3))-methyltransferase [Gilvimarinus sp. SDUM040013]